MWISSGILLLALFSLWIRLPLASSGIRMSPDETANIVSAVSYARQGTFGLQSEYTEQFFWLVPRSFVFVPETKSIAPIGFLGMSLVLSLVYKSTGYLGLGFFVPILALITIFALWRILPKQWHDSIKLITIVVWMSFPSVIIYTNRGVFPQMTQLCLMIWIWYLVNHERKKITYPIAGLLAGLALAIRPLEAIWIIPAIIFAFLHRQTNYVNNVKRPRSVASAKECQTSNETNPSADVGRATWDVRRMCATCDTVLFAVPLILFLLFATKLGADTYGKWFTSGYQIRPEVVTNIEIGDTTQEAGASYSRSVGLLESLPFGIHPRNVFWNVKNYFGIMLWPWMLVLLAALYFLYRDKAWNSSNKWGIIAMTWSLAAVTVFYGNGVYQDHVRLNQISVGNSFLRYTLPASIVFALASGYLLSKMMRLWTLKTLGYCLAVCLIMFGVWTAVARDDEGIAANERELIAYQQIRQAAAKSLGQNAIVLSDRSDKIFFPHWLSASPMPTKTQIAELVATGAEVAIFQTTQDEKGIADWNSYNLNLIPRFTINNQTMYHIEIKN